MHTLQCSLLQLNLESNPLGGVLPSALPWDAEFLPGSTVATATNGSAPSLRFLTLGNCSVTGQLPSSWSGLTHLAELEMLNLRGWVISIARPFLRFLHAATTQHVQAALSL